VSHTNITNYEVDLGADLSSAALTSAPEECIVVPSFWD